ncbi:hypothetical protein ACWCPM_02850 [Streptomyces sp. NPDC002309]
MPRKRTGMPAVTAGTLLLLLATACTTPRTGDAAPPAPSSPTPSPTHRTAPVLAPDLDSDETLAGRHPATRGNAAFPCTGGPQGKALLVAISCVGGGSVTVDLPRMDSSFRQECDPDTPTETYNQLAVPEAGKPGTVRVEAPTTVTWAVTIGRTDPVEADE